MKKADIIEKLKEEIQRNAELVNFTYNAKNEMDNSLYRGKVIGLCYALSLYGFEIDRTELIDQEHGLRKVKEIEINSELFFHEK